MTSFLIKDSSKRNGARLKWWTKHPENLAESLTSVGEIHESWKTQKVPKEINDYTYSGKVPVFYGHYWLRTLMIWDHLACLNRSVAKGGHLAAYRWDEKDRLNSEHLVVIKS